MRPIREKKKRKRERRISGFRKFRRRIPPLELKNLEIPPGGIEEDEKEKLEKL
jgi:hypothetical protein